jgi:2'-5' RNA ligase
VAAANPRDLTVAGRLGPPSDRTAVIVRARLPAGLERIRRRLVHNAPDGVPAHMTLLHPFVEPGRLGSDVRRTLAEVAAGHAPFDYQLSEMATWPLAVYVAVRPVEPFVRIQHDLQDAFFDFPIYGETADFEFVPHVTIADRDHVAEPGLERDRAWRALPQPARALAIDVIGKGADGRWRLIWRVPLGRMPG